MTTTAHPNELDLRRISRLLKKRERYQYVLPVVQAVPGGYRIVSPCCSRNIDQDGGLIDIARIEWEAGVWRLYSRNHACAQWLMHSQASHLDRLMEGLNEDRKRVFWQ
jgi:Protein of unknown function (DUF3024)